jgi:four helix bundle protein
MRRDETVSRELKPLEGLRNLEVKRVAVQLAIRCQKLTHRLPIEEQLNLTQQIRRSAVSIASNIAEGYARRTARGYAHYLMVAYGSLLELDTQLEIAHGAGYLSDEDLPEALALVVEAGQLLGGLVLSLDASAYE